MMNQYPTLIDIKNSLAPGDGALMDVAEVLVAEHAPLNDIIWKEGKLTTGDVFAKRTAMPKGKIRKLNEGIYATTSKKKLETETCVEVADMAAIDMSELNLVPNKQEYLFQESRPHIVSLGEDVLASMFYGADQAGILGFANRYGKLNGETKDQIIDYGGTGDHLCSAFFVKWHPVECTGIYPKNSKAGLSIEPMGKQMVDENGAPGKKFPAHVTWYRWQYGLKVRDHRYVSRVCNIPLDDIMTDTEAVIKLLKLMVFAKNKVYNYDSGHVVCYVPPTLYSVLEAANVGKDSGAIRYPEIKGKIDTPHVFGVPLRRNSCMEEPEKKVA